MRRPIQERFEDKFTKSGGCWEWTARRHPLGYGMFRIAGSVQYAHRVSYRLYVDEIPEGMCVCHHCDNPGCVNPAHLFLGTHTDNMRDCNNKGRRPAAGVFGEKHGMAKLTNAQVVEIRKMRSEGATQFDIAKEFGVARQTISHILCGDTWASV